MRWARARLWHPRSTPDRGIYRPSAASGNIAGTRFKPPLVLFDEPLSALDAVTQKHTAKLVADLQAEEGFAALIVTHDLGYACAFADTIAVLRAGLVEEVARPDEFLKSPESAYGQRLREAAIGLGALERVE